MTNVDAVNIELVLGDKVAAIRSPSSLQPGLVLGVVAGFTPAGVRMDMGPHCWKQGARDAITVKNKYVRKITREWYEANV